MLEASPLGYASTLIGLVVSLSLFRLLPLKLSQGESRYIDTGIVVFGMSIVGLADLLLCALLGAVLGGIWLALRNRRRGIVWANEYISALLVQLLGIQLAGLIWFFMRSLPDSGDWILFRAITLGLAYGLATEFLYQVLARLRGKNGKGSRGFMRIAESVVLLQVVHITLASAALRALGTLGVFSPLFCALLAAVLHYGLLLYTRMRAAYAQTIRAVSAAISMALGEPDEEPAALADLCVDVARRLGCARQTLACLNDAALMSRLGMVSSEAKGFPDADEACGALSFLARSARIVAGIPYLSGAAKVLDPASYGDDTSEFELAAEVLRACTVYTRARSLVNSDADALEIVAQHSECYSRRVMEVLKDVVAAST